MFEVIAFDADDTLWHTEAHYAAAQELLKRLLAGYASPEQIEQTQHAIEIRNLPYYGYGIKGFALSLIEAAIEISQGRISGQAIQQMIGLTKEMLTGEVQLLEHAQEVVAQLSGTHSLMLVTKGDLFDQESKIARSGLKPYFRHIEIISEKTADRYAALLARYHIEPSRFLMVGNSLRSDVLPVIALGGRAVHIPYAITWAHEDLAPSEAERGRYYELEHLGLLPALVEELSRDIVR